MAIKSSVSGQIDASPEAVFAVASDFAGAPQRISGIKRIEMLTHGPVGVGTKFRETRVMFGKEATATMEVVDFQPGRSYTLRADEGGCEYRTTVSVRPAAAPSASHGNAGTSMETPRRSELTFDMTGTPRTFGAKLMAALMGWMMNGMCAKAIRQDVADVKKATEHGTAR